MPELDNKAKNQGKKNLGDRWGKHMQIPEIREILFDLSKMMNPPRKNLPKRRIKDGS